MDPWGLKKSKIGRERCWCSVAQETINGRESSKETPFSWLPLEPKEDTPMSWEHPICGMPWSKQKKIRELILVGYTTAEIMQTLGGEEVNIRVARCRMRKANKKAPLKKRG